MNSYLSGEAAEQIVSSRTWQVQERVRFNDEERLRVDEPGREVASGSVLGTPDSFRIKYLLQEWCGTSDV